MNRKMILFIGILFLSCHSYAYDVTGSFEVFNNSLDPIVVDIVGKPETPLKKFELTHKKIDPLLLLQENKEDFTAFFEKKTHYNDVLAVYVTPQGSQEKELVCTVSVSVTTVWTWGTRGKVNAFVRSNFNSNGGKKTGYYCKVTQTNQPGPDGGDSFITTLFIAKRY